MGLMIFLTMASLVAGIASAAISSNSANSVAETTTTSNENIASENAKTQETISQNTIASNENIAAQQIAAQKEINAQNIAFQQAENEITRQREDTALQRKMADGLAAGLSPLGALGFTGASSSALTAPSADGSGIFGALQGLMSGNTSASGALASAIGSNNAKRIDNNNVVANIKANAINQRLEAVNSVFNNLNSTLDSFSEFKRRQAEIAKLQADTKTQGYINDYYDKFGYSDFNLNKLIANILESQGYDKDKIPNLVEKIPSLVEKSLPKVLNGNLNIDGFDSSHSSLPRFSLPSFTPKKSEHKTSEDLYKKSLFTTGKQLDKWVSEFEEFLKNPNKKTAIKFDNSYGFSIFQLLQKNGYYNNLSHKEYLSKISSSPAFARQSYNNFMRIYNKVR